MNTTPLLALFCMVVGAAIGFLVSTNRRTPTPAAVGMDSIESRGDPVSKDFVTIGVYNIQTGRGLDGRTDLKRLAETIQASEADCVSLHEVKAAFAGRPDQGSAIARELDFACLFSPSRTRWLRDYRGNALISRFTIGPWQREPLVDDTNKNFRILTTTSIEVSGVKVPVLFTHLHTRGLRDAQLNTVFRRFIEAGTGPAILMGDLNIRRDDPLINKLLDSVPEATDAIHQTLGEKDPEDRVDWIITRQLNVEAGGMTPPGASDHAFYWVSLSTSL